MKNSLALSDITQGSPARNKISGRFSFARVHQQVMSHFVLVYVASYWTSMLMSILKNKLIREINSFLMIRKITSLEL